MPNYTYDFSRFNLSADTGVGSYGSAPTLIAFDTLVTGFSQLSEITMDLVTNKGRLDFSASATTTWDYFRVNMHVQGTSTLSGGQRMFLALRDDNTEYVLRNYSVSDRTNNQCSFYSPWIPVQNSYYIDPVAWSSDTSWSLMGTVSWGGVHMCLEAIKAI